MYKYITKKLLLSLSMGIFIGLGIAITYAANITSISGTYNSGDTLGIEWFNDIKARLSNIYGSGSNVGIGTSSPITKLDVNGNQRIVGNSNFNLPIESSYDLSLQTITTNRKIYFAGNGHGYSIQSTELTSGNNTPLTLNPNGGNVGIGTSSPTTKLDVVGDIRATGYIYAKSSPESELKSIIAGACIAGSNGVGSRFITTTTTSGQNCATACNNKISGSSCYWGVTTWSYNQYYGYNYECSTGVNYQQGSTGYICCCSPGTSATYPIW